ncbi:hypothetical protein [Nocardia brasiliensis]|uniref:hypothetical protein n=1 Tax=Nocardia brasiliensis TaxID=37326 RepID=UPI002455346D|nr:hypothetical protein [Nocardia brasiliensis]
MNPFKRRRGPIPITKTYRRPGPEADRLEDDLYTYAGIRILISRDPDRPGTIQNFVKVDDRAPCLAVAAQALRGIAAEFEQIHATQGCNARRPADPREPGQL